MANALEADLNSTERKFLELCTQVINDCGLSLYDFHYNPGSGLLQVFIENPETGTALIEDCVKVDRGFDAYLEEDWLPANLTLEVSSPGVYRNLVTAKHFESALGQPVMLNLKKRFEEIVGLENCPKKLKGQKKVKLKLVSQTDQGLALKFDDLNVEIPFADIKKANLETD
ncbi:MAG: ribosome maturation factor RimP [bacterium]